MRALPLVATNPAIDDTEIIMRTLTPAQNYGSVDTAVLFFSNVTRSPSTSGIDVTSTAANGTVLTIHRPGIWWVVWSLVQANNTAVVAGITVNSTTLTAASSPFLPPIGPATVVASSFTSTVVGQGGNIALAHPVAIRNADLVAGGGVARMRMQANDGAGAQLANGVLSPSFGQIVVRYAGGLAA